MLVRSRRAGVLGLVVVVSLVCWLVLYPRAITLQYGNHLPERWKAPLLDKSVGEIRALLGPPDAEFSAKDFLSWQIETWFGSQNLFVVARNCCDPRAIPSSIIYKVYVDGWYRPVVNRSLGGFDG
jgi:hypothetical protein